MSIVPPRGSTAASMRHALPQRRRHVVRWVVLAVVLALVAVGVWVGVRFQHAVDSATQGHGGSAIDLLLPKALRGEDTGRVNILLAGNSFDDTGHDGAALTDSIMVASMELATHKIAVISIPRDLWVDYGGRHLKVNAVYPLAASGTAGANTLGDAQAGMTALGQVAEQVTGLRIDQYALVGYRALQDVVDAVGGIDVVIHGTESKGIFDPAAGVNLPEGPQHIDGLTALRLSRARNDKDVSGNEGSYGVADSDFGRTRNQRMVLSALLAKVKTTPSLANPATMVTIFDSISNNVRTDLSVAQVRRIYDLSSSSPGFQSLTVKGDDSHELLRDYTDAEDGASDALAPTAGVFDYTEIRAYLAAALAS